MTDFNHQDPHQAADRPSKQGTATSLTAFLRSTAGRLTIVSLAVVGVFLAVEHQARLIEWLPWLFVLACPLMHVFMHKGHGGHADHGHDHAPQVRPVRVPVTSRREPRG